MDDILQRSCILFTPVSEYLLGACRFYENALSSAGLNVKTVDPRRSTDLITDACGIMDGALLFLLSFEGDCTDITLPDGKNLFEVVQRPLISLCEFEPPAVCDAARIIFGLRDRHKVNESYYFAPYPGLCVKDETKERDLNAVFFYEEKDPDSFREQWKSDVSTARICEDMLDIVLSNERTTACQAFDTVMESYGIYLENWKFKLFSGIPNAVYAKPRRDFKNACIWLVNSFIESYRRRLLLDTLTQSGIILTVLPSLGFNEYLRILKRAKIVVNADAALEYSLPRHMSCGMASGAVLACDGNGFVDEVFSGDDYISYGHNDYKTLADKIKNTLTNPARLAELAANGERIIQEGYTPAHAVEKLVLAADYSLLLHN